MLRRRKETDRHRDEDLERLATRKKGRRQRQPDARRVQRREQPRENAERSGESE